MDVAAARSPWWLQKKLLQSGHRPINNIVDITNYVLHEYGQPLHAFDASKVSGKIVVRPAKKGEVIVALDGKEYKLSAKHLVIADEQRALAIAGVMGGQESGTTAATTAVVFEAAAFDPVSIRKTSRDLNLQSDSQLIFEKGLSTEALPAALARAIELAKELAGGQLTGVTDVRLSDYKPQAYPVLFKKIRSRIGVDIADDQISDILTRLGFKLEKTGSRVVAQVPYWRDHDIEAEVDLTEEVARIYGYHNMPFTLPSAPPPATQDDPTLVWELWTKRFLATVGYTEFFGYSFVDVKTLEKYAVSPESAVRVFNPLAEDLSHLRPTLMPSLLRDIERNQANMPAAKVFELSRVHIPRQGDLPEERFRLVVAEYGNENAEAAFMNLKGTLEALGEKTGIMFVVSGKSNDNRWHPSRHALVSVDVAGDKKVVGVLGQVADVTQEAFGILRPVFVLDLDLEAIMPLMRKVMSYSPVAEFPVVTRDISFVVTEQTVYEDLVTLIKEQSILVRSVALVDIYRGPGVEERKKSMTLSVTLASQDRTLTSAEVDEVMTTVGHNLTGKFGAVLRG